ncbi:MAG TPA: VWA domain-containing protein [Candidatus Paceibacterota bacterium]|nr:VWA domain-containing protein [Candidatus Paceibacterota bacterium]HMO82855.1 VWA domain-containing protein [Candidatus Paceibacterota bacterium]
MESPLSINTIQKKTKGGDELGHEKALDFFEIHRKLFEQYAGHSIEVEPAPPGFDTFAFNLETNTIYLNSKFYDSLGYPEAGTAFATFHEIEHFREKLALLTEENGARVFSTYLNNLDPNVSTTGEAYSLMDNCISDVRQNSAVVSRTHAGFAEVEKNLYQDVQFPETDFTKEPLHIQLPYAILNEYRSGRECTVDPRVRQILTELQQTPNPSGGTLDILELMTNPNPRIAPMSKRLALQDAFVWPKILELLEEDKREAEKQKSQPQGEGGKEGDLDPNTPKEKDGAGEGKEKAGQSKDNSKPSDQGEKGETKPAASNNAATKKGEPESGGVATNQKPNDLFKEAYDAAKKRVPNAQPIEVQRQALKDWIEENSDPEKQANKKLAEKLGVKEAEVKAYKDIAKGLHAKNPEMKESVIDALERVIRDIISRRLKAKQMPKYPVEEGDELVDPASWLAEVRSGNFEPKVWEDTEIKLKKDKLFGEVEITLVCDRSSSMAGEKQREQQKALVLFMEALKRFNDILDDEEEVLEKPLLIKSEVYTFQADANDALPLKKMGKALSEKERIQSCTRVQTVSGNSTTDFVPLESIERSLTTEVREKIKDGELKKVVIVFTDGDSDDPRRVQRVLATLRQGEVIVIGVGITESGKNVLTTYAPKATMAKKAEDLPTVLRETLTEILEGV